MQQNTLMLAMCLNVSVIDCCLTHHQVWTLKRIFVGKIGMFLSSSHQGPSIKDVGIFLAIFDTPPPPCQKFDPDLPNLIYLISCNIDIWDPPKIFRRLLWMTLQISPRWPCSLTFQACRSQGGKGSDCPPDFDRSLNPIPTRVADYAHQLTTRPPDFKTFLTALRVLL